MKIDTITNLFMVSSQFSNVALPIVLGSPPRLYAHLLSAVACKTANHHQAIQDLAWRLLRVAEIAYGARDIDALKEVSELLMGLPLQSARDAGLYYRALIARRQGNFEQARQLLDPLTESASPVIQARSVQALGTVYEAEGNTNEAIRLYTHTLREARHVDPLSFACAAGQLSVIKSNEGDHERALTDLENALPVVRIASQRHPHLFFQYHNELAVELHALGRTDEARAHSRVACNSQIAARYQEWQETAEELREPERVLVAVPERKQAQKAKSFSNHLEFPTARNFRPASTGALVRTVPAPIIAQVKARAPDRAPPAFFQ